MTFAGWIFMLSSIGIVLMLLIFCYSKILRSPQKVDHMHAPLDIDTKDLE